MIELTSEMSLLEAAKRRTVSRLEASSLYFFSHTDEIVMTMNATGDTVGVNLIGEGYHLRTQDQCAKVYGVV